MIEDPGATNAADVPPANAPEPGASNESPDDDSSDGTTSSVPSTDGGNPAIFGVRDTRDAAGTVSDSDVDAGPDAGDSAWDVDAGVDAGESASTPDRPADSGPSSSTGAF